MLKDRTERISWQARKSINQPRREFEFSKAGLSEKSQGPWYYSDRITTQNSAKVFRSRILFNFFFFETSAMGICLHHKALRGAAAAAPWFCDEGNIRVRSWVRALRKCLNDLFEACPKSSRRFEKIYWSENVNIPARGDRQIRKYERRSEKAKRVK